MSQAKETTINSKGEIVVGKTAKVVEAIIYAKDTEGRNYCITRTATGYPSITFLRGDEFEQLKFRGIPEISLEKAEQMQKEFLPKSVARYKKK